MKAFIAVLLCANAALAAPTIKNQEVVQHDKVASGQQVMSEEQLGQLMQLTKMIPQTETDIIKQQALEMALGVLNKKRKRSRMSNDVLYSTI